MKVTIEKLAELNACSSGVEMFQEQFVKEAELKDVITWATGQDIEAMRYANWLIVRLMARKDYMSYAVFAAKQVIEIFESKYPNDKRPRLAIEAAEACILNDSEENKKNARAAADAAYAAADAAADAAAYSAAYAAYAAYSYAYAAAAADAYAAAYTARKEMMVKILEYGLTLIEQKGGAK